MVVSFNMYIELIKFDNIGVNYKLYVQGLFFKNTQRRKPPSKMNGRECLQKTFFFSIEPFCSTVITQYPSVLPTTERTAS